MSILSPDIDIDLATVMELWLTDPDNRHYETGETLVKEFQQSIKNKKPVLRTRRDRNYISFSFVPPKSSYPQIQWGWNLRLGSRELNHNDLIEMAPNMAAFIYRGSAFEKWETLWSRNDQNNGRNIWNGFSYLVVKPMTGHDNQFIKSIIFSLTDTEYFTIRSIIKNHIKNGFNPRRY